MRRAFRMVYEVLLGGLICMLACAPAAYGLASEDAALLLDVPGDIGLSCIDVRQLPFATDPASVEVGISCGMKGMCGQDPCLCGSSDEWGTCSCNGLKSERPTYTLSAADGSDAGFIRIVDAPGGPWLVSAGAGEADVVVTAELAHHVPASAKAHVRVAPFGPLDALKVVLLLASAALVLLGLVAGVRGLTRAARKVVARLPRSVGGAYSHLRKE